MVAKAKAPAAKKALARKKAAPPAPAGAGLGELTQVVLGTAERTHQRSVRKLDKREVSKILKGFDPKQHAVYLVQTADTETETHYVMVRSRTGDVWG